MAESKARTKTVLKSKGADSKEWASLVECLFRKKMGAAKMNGSGFFVSHCLTRVIHAYWDWVDYIEGDRLIFHGERFITAAVVSGDGRFLFIGDESGHLSFMDLSIGSDETIHELHKGHARKVRCLASHSGYIASGSEDSTRIWGVLPELNLISERKSGKHGSVEALGLSSDAEKILSSVRGNTSIRGRWNMMMHTPHMRDVIVTWNHGCIDLRTQDGRLLNTVPNQAWYSIIHGCVNSERSMIAFLYDKSPKIYSLPQMDVIAAFPDWKVRWAADFHPIHPDLLAMTDDTSVRIVNVRSRVCIQVWNLHRHSYSMLRFTPDGSRLICIPDSKIFMIDTSDLRCLIE